MMSQTSQKGLHKFIVTVEYYHGMWVMSSHRLKPLTRLTSKNIKFKQTDAEQKSFNEVKKIVALNTLLFYPDLKTEFDINTNDRYFKPG